ncbi:hypothetical protein IJG14_05090 [bacterium]|nr:hypothetical protein [bacterium]
MSDTIAFDPGIGNLAVDFYTEAYIIENDLANMPQYARKVRYYNVVYKKLMKAFLNNLAFFKGCLAWAYYIVNEKKDADITGNPFVSYTEEQKAQYAPTEMIDFTIEYFEKFKSDLKYYHIKNVEFPDFTTDILNKYREFLAINEGFINAHKVSDIKLPENLEFTKTLDEIKNIIDDVIKTKNSDNLLSL